MVYKTRLTFLQGNIIPHVQYRNHLPDKQNDQMYCCVSLAEGLVNHSYAQDKKYHYHHSNRDNGRYKIASIFLDTNETVQKDRFKQVDDGIHKFLGRSPYGGIPDVIIQIRMSDESESYADATFTVLKGPNVMEV